ncbi:uncharacterized protein GLRG_09464 [Colletotrichum graminicola M1.001]|uniref:Ecp2 effector protein domain-containing protein n=1 Tax=Colletotrichum graminicola (strain M1.001 / M2 / FGSC 10212) TaxID=645133 RepID=E3QTY2_COLGM|nr:uncharacterized protein GLRG_09464 [Colletotrichum graminicola M1.001]EFQ34320.1 hypothetical protein GLRG_09464 [Colletotrichum graminicola M1.001]
MHLPLCAAFPLTFLVTVAQARALGHDATSSGAPIPGNGMFIPRWEMASPDGSGSMVNLRGTVQEVVKAMRGMRPSFDIDEQLDKIATPAVGRRNAYSNAFDNINTLCHLFTAGNRTAAYEGIEDLKKVQGRPMNGAGPGNCGRVSCRKNTGIWWCNDAQSSRELASFGEIVDGAQRVLKKCQDKPSADQGDGMTVSGQAFHMDNWNVIVRGGDNCDDAGVNLGGGLLGRFVRVTGD